MFSFENNTRQVLKFCVNLIITNFGNKPKICKGHKILEEALFPKVSVPEPCTFSMFFSPVPKILRKKKCACCRISTNKLIFSFSLIFAWRYLSYLSICVGSYCYSSLCGI